jgi:hypothetical protein
MSKEQTNSPHGTGELQAAASLMESDSLVFIFRATFDALVSK